MKPNPPKRFLALAVISLCWQLGCGSKPIEVRHADIVDLSSPIETSSFDAPYDPNMGTVKIALAQVTCAVAVTGRRSEFEQVTRSQMMQLLHQSKNFALANRAVTAEAQAEWGLVTNKAANPQTIPTSYGMTIPSHLIKVTITQVDRNIQSSSEDKEWALYWAMRSSEERRDGAIAMVIEVVDIATMETVYTTRSHGRLFDIKSSSGASVFGVGGGKQEYTRVPESHAIRAACQQAVKDIHQHFASGS